MHPRTALLKSLSVTLATLLIGSALAWVGTPVRAQSGNTPTPSPLARIHLPYVLRNDQAPPSSPTLTLTPSRTAAPAASTTPGPTPTGPNPIVTLSLSGTPLPTRTSVPGGVQRPEERHTVQSSSAAAITYKYWRYLPPAWASDTARTWPVLIFLHGLGEIGSDPNVVLRNGPPRLINEGNDMCFDTPTGGDCLIVLSPQVPAGQSWWSNATISDVIAIATGQLRGDPQRIYLTGLSMGGGGTWDFAAGVTNSIPNARLLAAIAPIAGASSPSGAGPCRLASERLAIFAFHGSADTVVPLANSENWVKAVNACTPAPDPAARLTIYPGVQHNSWSVTYDPRFQVEPGRNLYQWFLQYRR